MEQRRLRLGDILDDYCPRERRVTNHAIVAMIEDDVKQTRCTTCDAEHAYKGGQAPRKRRKDSTSALYKEVLAGMPDSVEIPVPKPADTLILTPPAALIDSPNGNDHADAEVEEPLPEEPSPLLAEEADSPEEVEPQRPGVDEGPIHRRLIRATLPRPEGQKEVRQAPDFTMHNTRPGGHFRGDRARGQGGSAHGNGMRRRFGASSGNGGRSGGGRDRPGFGGNGRGPAGNHGRPQGGRKRSR